MANPSSPKAPKVLCSKRVMDMILYALACDIAAKLVHTRKMNMIAPEKKTALRSAR